MAGYVADFTTVPHKAGRTGMPPTSENARQLAQNVGMTPHEATDANVSYAQAQPCGPMVRHSPYTSTGALSFMNLLIVSPSF